MEEIRNGDNGASGDRGTPDVPADGQAVRPEGPECAVLLVRPSGGKAVEVKMQPIREAKRPSSTTDLRAMCAEILAVLDANMQAAQIMNQMAQMEQEERLQEIARNPKRTNPGNIMDFMRRRKGR